MRQFDEQAALRELCRMALPSGFLRRGLDRQPAPAYDVDLQIRSGQIQRFELRWPELRWSALCDQEGVSLNASNNETFLRWERAPVPNKLKAGALRDAKYEAWDQLISYPLASEGEWSHITCPGAFGIWLHNAVLRGNCC